MSHLAFFGFPKLKFIVPPKFTIHQQHASYMCDHAKKTHPKKFFKSDPSHLVLGHGKLVGYLNTTKSQKMQKNCPSKTLSKRGSNFWGKMNDILPRICREYSHFCFLSTQKTSK